MLKLWEPESLIKEKPKSKIQMYIWIFQQKLENVQLQRSPRSLKSLSSDEVTRDFVTAWCIKTESGSPGRRYTPTRPCFGCIPRATPGDTQASCTPAGQTSGLAEA